MGRVPLPTKREIEMREKHKEVKQLLENLEKRHLKKEEGKKNRTLFP